MILAFYGASGLGAEFYNMAKVVNAQDHRWDKMIFVDDAADKVGTVFDGLEVLGYQNAVVTYGVENLEFIISIGEPRLKEDIYRKLKKDGCKLANLIHPENTVPENAKLGEGILVHRYSGIPPMAVIGNNVLIQGKTAMGHGVVLGDNVVISSFAFVGGDTEIGENAYIGPHSCLRNGIKIGKNTVIGMGSVVTKDIPDNAVAYGNPCVVKKINENTRVFGK